MGEGFLSLEEHMQEYLELFLLLQQEKGEDLPVLFEERSRRLAERERETEIFLPAVYLRECYALTDAEYWAVMFAFCCELESGLCIDFRDKFKENWPSLQYVLHLLSPVMPVDFSDVAELCGKKGAMGDILELCPEEGGGREQRGFLQRSLLISPAVFHFLLTGGLLPEEWYTFFPVQEKKLPEGRELCSPYEREFFPLHEREYGKLCGYLGTGEPLRILLYGRRGSGSHTLVRRACRKERENLLIVRTRTLVQGSRSERFCARQTLRLIVRLTAPVIIMELPEGASGSSDVEEWEEELKRLVQDFGDSFICFLARTKAQASLVKEYTDVSLSLREELSWEEARLALDSWMEQENRRHWQEELLKNYRLNIGELKQRYRAIALRVQGEARSFADREVWIEGIQEKQEAFRFGRLIETGCGQEEIILPADCERQLKTVIRLAKGWQGQKGMQLMFHGSSGTGKTMAASVLAAELQLSLFKVDLSQVFDKYIGETEKHIDEIFGTARRNHYLLFFDEADALFAKRTAVKDSHDRYANVSAAFLLQRMEEYDGVLILATNLKDHFDDAFVRRIRFVIKFRNLDREGRERLWKKALAGELPAAGDVDFGALAGAAELSPARICAAAHMAKQLASCDGSGTITKAHLLEALALEAGKDETAIKRF